MSKKVLICDDEEGIRESLKLILEDHYDLIVVDSGEQCLETLKNSKDIGLLLIDVKMPEVNGLEVIAQVKDTYPNLKYVVVTGYKSVQVAEEAARLGAADYIVKPFNSKEILEAVKKFFPR